MDGLQIFTMLTCPLSIACARVSPRLPVTALVAGLYVLSTSPAFAEEPILEFVEGLRERQYFDTALEFLDAAPQRADVSPELRDVIDLERAKTLQAWVPRREFLKIAMFICNKPKTHCRNSRVVIAIIRRPLLQIQCSVNCSWNVLAR